MYDRGEIIEALQIVAENGIPSFDAARILDVGTGNYLDYFKSEIIGGVLAQGGSTCCFFEGVYGSGKSHLLQLFQHLSAADRMLVAEIGLANDLNFSNWHTVTRRVLELIQYRTEHGVIQSLPGILQHLALKGSAQGVSLKKHSLPHVGFVNAIEIYLNRYSSLDVSQKDKLARFLTGERISVKDLRACGIQGVKNPLSQRNAELVFKTVLSALHHVGFPGTLILFDEIDQSFQNVLRATERVKVAANLIRRLIDSCTLGGLKGVCLVFAVSQNFIPRCASVYPALGERLEVSSPAPGWRSPVIRLDAINFYADQQSFVRAAIGRFMEISAQLGLNVSIHRLETSSHEIMSRHAGLDFRRPLMRQFSSILLEHAQT